MPNCLFCSIIEGKVKGEIIYQDDTVLSFNDISHQAPDHVLIEQRKQIE